MDKYHTPTARPATKGARPKFNVSEPFEGIIAVQMNTAFFDLLCNFIYDCDDREPQIVVFLDVLRGRNEFNKASGFAVSPKYGDVIIVQMEESFATLLRTFISEIDHVESEIWAFKQALTDPAASIQLRVLNKLQKSKNPSGRRHEPAPRRD